MQPKTAARTIEEFHTVVDNLDKAISTALSTTTEKDYSREYANVTIAFRAIQYNTMTLANAVRSKLDSHRVDIRYGRVDIEKPDVNENTKKVDIPEGSQSKISSKEAKKKSTAKKKAKKQ